MSRQWRLTGDQESWPKQSLQHQRLSLARFILLELTQLCSHGSTRSGGNSTTAANLRLGQGLAHLMDGWPIQGAFGQLNLAPFACKAYTRPLSHGCSCLVDPQNLPPVQLNTKQNQDFLDKFLDPDLTMMHRENVLGALTY